MSSAAARRVSRRPRLEETDMKLFYAPGACSMSPHIALREAGLPFELVKVDLAAKTIESGDDYHAINGKGYVPALELDDGRVLTEGPAIVQYIADRKPEVGLAPAVGTIERYKLQEWLNFITSELHKPMGSMFNKAQTPEWKEAVKATLTRRLDFLAKELSGRSYLIGHAFSVADGYLFTVLGWAAHVGFDLSRWPAIGEYLARIGARPHVVEAMKAEGLLEA
jgi:glutathione S-transferase